jgi:hypothetical protein
MKNILSGLDLNEKTRILEMHYSRSKNNYLPLIMESAQSEASAAAKAFKAKHKGRWNNVGAQWLQYAGNEFFFTQLMTDPKTMPSGGYMASTQINIIKIGTSKYGCPVPVWMGYVWMNENGTASAPEITESVRNMNEDTTAGWKGFNASMYGEAYGLNTETFSTYCTNFGNTYGTQFDNYIKQNLKSFENQPGGLAGKLWLAVKPSIDRAKGVVPAPTPIVKKN